MTSIVIANLSSDSLDNPLTKIQLRSSTFRYGDESRVALSGHK